MELVTLTLTDHSMRSLQMGNFVRRLLTIGIATLLGTGCLSVTPRRGGVKIEESFVQSISKGSTTGESVRSKLGAPQSITRAANGTETWTYTGWEGRPATIGYGYDRMRSRSLSLTIRNGVVVDYMYSTSDSRP